MSLKKEGIRKSIDYIFSGICYIAIPLIAIPLIAISSIIATGEDAESFDPLAVICWASVLLVACNLLYANAIKNHPDNKWDISQWYDYAMRWSFSSLLFFVAFKVFVGGYYDALNPKKVDLLWCGFFIPSVFVCLLSLATKSFRQDKSVNTEKGITKLIPYAGSIIMLLIYRWFFWS